MTNYPIILGWKCKSTILRNFNFISIENINSYFFIKTVPCWDNKLIEKITISAISGVYRAANRAKMEVYEKKNEFLKTICSLLVIETSIAIIFL